MPQIDDENQDVEVDQVESESRLIEAEESVSTKTSAAVTLVVFMAALLLVRWVMPTLVEEVHYSIERGKQRARYELANDHLGQDPLANLSSASQLVAQRIAPSVVHIDTMRSAPKDSVAKDAPVHGQGSGVVLSSDGEILTNFHVVEGARTVVVTFSDDRERRADVVSVYPELDLALLKVNGVRNLVPAEWGDSDILENGSMVWAAGSPFGLSKSTTFGIVSGKGRNLDAGKAGRIEYLQSDAVVQAGNSGGPLVNSIGQVVGINTAILGENFQGVSFSIPSNLAKRTYEESLKRDQVGWLGVQVDTVPRQLGGALVGFVLQGSPAEVAGIEQGDIVTRWGNEIIDSSAELISLVRRTKVAETVQIEVIRAPDQTQTIDVRVGPKPLRITMR